MVVAESSRPTLGPIERGVSYPLPLFSERTRMNKSAIARARRNGLKVRRVGRLSFILGDDWLAFLERAEVVGAARS